MEGTEEGSGGGVGDVGAGAGAEEKRRWYEWGSEGLEVGFEALFGCKSG